MIHNEGDIERFVGHNNLTRVKDRISGFRDEGVTTDRWGVGEVRFGRWDSRVVCSSGAEECAGR